MKQRQVNVNNDSFNRAGITKDSKEAICEYIWNGFEAGATEVEVSFSGAPMREAMSIKIVDNGDGIEYGTLDETFGAFLSSIKNVASIRLKSQLNKGRGRFSYQCFSSFAEWHTVYDEEGTLKKYSITTSNADRKNYTTTDVVNAPIDAVMGTSVEIPLNDQATLDQLSYNQIKQKLLQEFSWFLYLNKKKNFSLKYEGNLLDYNQYIDSDLSLEETITIDGISFNVNLILWNQKIDNSSKIYYLSDSGEIYAAQNTGYNKNTVEFYHNVFIVSDYINAQNTAFLQDGDDAPQQKLEAQDGSKKIFWELKKEISKLIEKTLKKFLVRQADNQFNLMEERGSLPEFPQDEYGELQRKDFETVTKELYCVEPRIFFKLNDKQEKSLLGFMNLLLSSEERENLLSIVEQVVALTPEQRKDFASILQRTKLQFIVDAIGVIERRIGDIEKLKQIVFDMSRFANERYHIQKIMEHCFWLFGEQYHLLTADKSLKTSLETFENITNTQPQEQESTSKKATKANKKLNQRADIFLYTQRTVDDSSNERLIVELKAPTVNLSLEVFNQIERYAHTIRKEPRFNATNRTWRFYAVCATVDDDVKTKYANFKQHGKVGLAGIIENFELYALSWDDIFQAFEARHNFLLEKLKLDFSKSLEISKAQTPSREEVNRLTKELIDGTSEVTL